MGAGSYFVLNVSKESRRANRVAGRIAFPAPTPPDMRVRIRRFRLYGQSTRMSGARSLHWGRDCRSGRISGVVGPAQRRVRATRMRTNLTCVIFMVFFSGWLRADVYKEQRTGIEFPEMQRTAAGRRGCNRRVSWPPSLSLRR